MKAARWLIGALAALAILLTALFYLSPSLDGWPATDNSTPPQDGQVSITFLGTSTILISDGRTHLLTDGYFSRVSIPELFLPMAPNHARITQALARAGIEKLDAIPVLHTHFDHVMDSGIVAQLTGAQLLGSSSAAMAASGSGLDTQRITTVQTHYPYHFGDFTLTFVPASHVPLPGAIENWTGKGEITEPVTPPAWIGAWEEGQSYGLVVEHPKARILVQGSAGMQPGELDRYDADYALVATASLGKQSDAYKDAYFQETVAAVGAHTIIPVHWDNFFMELSEDVPALPWVMDNLEDSFQALAGRHDGRFLVLRPFQTLGLAPPAAPAEDAAP